MAVMTISEQTLLVMFAYLPNAIAFPFNIVTTGVMELYFSYFNVPFIG